MATRTLHPMGLTVGDRQVRPLTADEVMRMVELGILSEDEPVELLHGALTAVSPKSPEHATVMFRLLTWLMTGPTAKRYVVRSEHPLVVPDHTSLPEPDVAVVEPGDYSSKHPATALLVIEVAVSSVRTDTRIKPALYAAAGVPELWVIDVPGRLLRCFRDPGTSGYATDEAVGVTDPVAPLEVNVAPLDLGWLFADL